MTGEQNTQELSNNPNERDYLEFLIYKIGNMRMHGQAYFARKMTSDKLLYDQARKELNTYLKLLEKRGYTGNRFKTVVYQKNIFDS